MVTLEKAVIPVYEVKLFYRTRTFSTMPIQYTLFMILNVFTQLYNQNFYIESEGMMIMDSGLEDASFQAFTTVQLRSQTFRPLNVKPLGFSRNVGHQLINDPVPHPRKTKNTRGRRYLKRNIFSLLRNTFISAFDQD